MLSLYVILTIKQKDAIVRVMHQYIVDTKFNMKHLGVAQYHIVMIVTDTRAIDYDIYFDPKNATKIHIDHGFSIQAMVNILLNRSEYGIIGKLRDTKHKILDSKIVKCIDGKNRIESRWNKLYVNRLGQIIKITYNLRVHEDSKRPILGIITCYNVDPMYINNNEQFKANYVKIVSRLMKENQLMLSESLLNKEWRAMKFERSMTREIVNLTEEQLFTLNKDELSTLSPCDEEDIGESLMLLTAAHGKQKDIMKLSYYYSFNDKIGDPDGSLHERYISYYDLEPLNEVNLLKYNHHNVDIFNKLLDNKYAEVGGKHVVTEMYVLTEWEEVCSAMFAIAYGYDQSIIYENLCAAFGKDRVDCVWCKYYEIP